MAVVQFYKCRREFPVFETIRLLNNIIGLKGSLRVVVYIVSCEYSQGNEVTGRNTTAVTNLNSTFDLVNSLLYLIIIVKTAHLHQRVKNQCSLRNAISMRQCIRGQRFKR
ncbi:DNA-directed RNA polymerase subunit beta' N-terminal section [Dirofilaria immitis]